MIVSIPLGVAAAIYLEEYASARNRLTRLIMVNIRNLAGVPAVIYGVLGLIIFVEWLDPITCGETVIAAGADDGRARAADRDHHLDGGDPRRPAGPARRRLRRRRVAVGGHPRPRAAVRRAGILTGTVLSIARALGEAAPLIILGAITGLLPATSIDGRFTALPMLIYNWSGRPDQPDAEVGWANAAAAAGLVLLVLVLFFNAAAILLRNRFEKRRTGT